MTTQAKTPTPAIEETSETSAPAVLTTAETTAKPKTKAIPKTTAKAKAKASNEPEPADARATEAAVTILKLVRKAGKVEGATGIATLATKFSKGTITNAGLVSLRDAITALSATLREENKHALAKEFAWSNRAVRRAERATRKGGQ